MQSKPGAQSLPLLHSLPSTPDVVAPRHDGSTFEPEGVAPLKASRQPFGGG